MSALGRSHSRRKRGNRAGERSKADTRLSTPACESLGPDDWPNRPNLPLPAANDDQCPDRSAAALAVVRHGAVGHAMALSYFDLPPGERVLREFTVCRDRHGRWVAVETHGLLGGVFATRKDAMRFALSEADGDADRVYVEPAAEPIHP